MENSAIAKLLGLKPSKMPQVLDITAAQNTSLSNSFDDAEVLEAEEINENPFLWDVQERPIYNQFGKPIEGYKSIVRSDNLNVLNICKQTYTPTTNEVLCDTARRISDISGLQISEYMEHKNGQVVEVWLKSPEPLIIGGHNYHNYMIVGNSHNSQHAFFVGSYTSMIRCNNQFSQVQHDMKAYHTANNLQQIKNIIRYQQAYQGINATIKDFLLKAEQMDMSPRQLREATLHLFNLKEEDVKRNRNIENFQRSLVAETSDLGRNGLGFFQAVTHFTTHVRAAKDRVYSNIFGSNSNLIERAIKFLNRD